VVGVGGTEEPATDTNANIDVVEIGTEEVETVVVEVVVAEAADTKNQKSQKKNWMPSWTHTWPTPRLC